MSYDYEECLEVVCVDKLHCSLRDLKALVPIYSELAKLSGVDSEVLSRMNDLELMAKYAYTTIRDSVAESIECQARIDRYIELIPDEDADTYVKYEVDDTLKRDLLELARKIKKAVPHYEDLTDIKFNSLIDDALDLYGEGFDDYPEHVAEYVVQVAYDGGLVRAEKEFEEVD